MNRENNFDLLRILAALLVMMGHMYSLIGIAAPTLLFSQLHSLGIIIFFVIGGYLISCSWENDRNYFRYLLKRVLRIIPALVVYVIFAACVVGPLVTDLPVREYFSNPLFINYFKNIRLEVQYVLPGVFTGNPMPAVNGSLWSLPVEFLMYLIIPLLCEIGKKGKGAVHVGLTLGICILAFCRAVFFPEWHYVIYGMDLAQVINIVPYYFLGSMIATLKVDKNVWNMNWAIVILVIAQGIQGFAASYILGYILIPYVVFSIAFGMEPLSAKIPIIRKFEISYGLYLYGFLVQQVVIMYASRFGISLSMSEYIVISVLFTTVLALLSQYFIEKPMQKVCKKILGRQKRGGV